MGSIVVQTQHDPLPGTVDVDEALDSSDPDMQNLARDLFDPTGGHLVDPKDEYGQRLITVPVSIQGSLDSSRYEAHRRTLGIDADAVQQSRDGRAAKSMIVIGPTFDEAGIFFGGSVSREFEGVSLEFNGEKEKHHYKLVGKQKKFKPEFPGTTTLLPSSYRVSDNEITWGLKYGKWDESGEIKPENVGTVAFAALMAYLLDKNVGDESVMIEDTAAFYGFRQQELETQISGQPNAGNPPIILSLDDMLMRWFVDAGATETGEAAAMVALVRFGFLKDAIAVDIENQRVIFANQASAQDFVNDLFGVGRREELNVDLVTSAGGQKVAKVAKPSDVDGTYLTSTGSGLHFWFYEGVQKTTDVFGGKGTQDNAIWSIAAYDDVRHALEEPVELPVSYDGLTPLDEVSEERRRSGIILPILVPDESTEPMVYDKMPELFTSAERSASGKSPMEDFQIPAGWRLPTAQEFVENFKQSSTAKVPDKPGFHNVPFTDEYGREIHIEKYVNFYTMPTAHDNLMPVVLVELPDEILEKIAVWWNKNKDAYLANLTAQFTPIQVAFIAAIGLSTYVGYKAYRQSRPDSTADVVARRASVFKEGLVELNGEKFAENTWYDKAHTERLNEVRNILEYYYLKVNNSQFSERQGALIGDSGMGKDRLMEMVGMALRFGYYSDGTPVEAKYLDTFGDTMYVDAAKVIAAEFRLNYDMSPQANLEAVLSLAKEYKNQTGKHLIIYITESYTALKMLNLARGQGAATYAYDIVFKTEKYLCICFLMTTHGDADTIGGADGFYSSNGGSNPTEMKRRVHPITLTGPSETLEEMIFANTNAGTNWDAGNIDHRKVLEPGTPGRVTPPPASQRPIRKVKFDPRKITVGKNAGLLRRVGQGIIGAAGRVAGRRRTPAATTTPGTTPAIQPSTTGPRPPTRGSDGSSGSSGTGAPPSPSGSPPPAPGSSTPPSSLASVVSPTTFVPKLTLAELAQLFPQLRQPFSNPQIAMQAITQNLTEAQRMIWKQRICPEGMPLPQSSYEIAARLQKVVGEQNAQMIFARTLFFCRSSTISSPALLVMLMNAAVVNPRALSDPARAVAHAEEIVKNYERLIEEKRGRGEKVEEEMRRAEAWRREFERQKQQRERAVAVPL